MWSARSSSFHLCVSPFVVWKLLQTFQSSREFHVLGQNATNINILPFLNFVSTLVGMTVCSNHVQWKESNFTNICLSPAEINIPWSTVVLFFSLLILLNVFLTLMWQHNLHSMQNLQTAQKVTILLRFLFQADDVIFKLFDLSIWKKMFLVWCAQCAKHFVSVDKQFWANQTQHVMYCMTHVLIFQISPTHKIYIHEVEGDSCMGRPENEHRGVIFADWSQKRMKLCTSHSHRNWNNQQFGCNMVLFSHQRSFFASCQNNNVTHKYSRLDDHNFNFREFMKYRITSWGTEAKPRCRGGDPTSPTQAVNQSKLL